MNALHLDIRGIEEYLVFDIEDKRESNRQGEAWFGPETIVEVGTGREECKEKMKEESKN